MVHIAMTRMAKPIFVATPAIEKKAQDRLLARIVAQLLKMLRRRGIISAAEWICSEEHTPDAQLTLEAMRLPVAPAEAASLHSSSASVLLGFSLHSAARAPAHDQAARLRLFRYVLRPAIATDKLTFDGKTVTFTIRNAAEAFCGRCCKPVLAYLQERPQHLALYP